MKILRKVPIACLIVAFLIAFIVGNEAVFGITTGWLLIMCASLFLGMEGMPPTKSALGRLIGGALYGILIGQFFALFKPVFIIAIIVLISCKLADKLPTVMNDYSLTFLAVYAINGVAHPALVWQDILIFAISVLILFLICTIIEKKVLHTLDNPLQPEPLSEEEKAKPYAKYYGNEVQPTPEQHSAMRKKIPAAQAMPITKLNDLCSKDAPYAASGYCIMPDGSGYVAERHFMPNATKEMMAWWSLWHPKEDLRYKLWYSPGHRMVKELKPHDAGLTTAMPAHIAGRESFGQSLLMVENTGLGDEYVSIDFLSPEQFGFDMRRLADGDIVWITGGNGYSWGMEPNSRKIPAVVCHVAYEADGGLVIQSHFWMGWHIDDGEAHLMLPPGGKLPIFGPKAMADHNVREFLNLGRILPKLYAEFGEGLSSSEM